MPDPARHDDELLIHMDIDGLAGFLRAVEAAMSEGRGHLALPLGCGMVVTRLGSARRFSGMTVTFVCDPRDERDPEPQPLPRVPVLELLD